MKFNLKQTAFAPLLSSAAAAAIILLFTPALASATTINLISTLA